MEQSSTNIIFYLIWNCCICMLNMSNIIPDIHYQYLSLFDFAFWLSICSRIRWIAYSWRARIRWKRPVTVKLTVCIISKGDKISNKACLVWLSVIQSKQYEIHSWGLSSMIIVQEISYVHKAPAVRSQSLWILVGKWVT